MRKSILDYMERNGVYDPLVEVVLKYMASIEEFQSVYTPESVGDKHRRFDTVIDDCALAGPPNIDKRSFISSFIYVLLFLMKLFRLSRQQVLELIIPIGWIT
jgi:hypothetical protein